MPTDAEVTSDATQKAPVAFGRALSIGLKVGVFVLILALAGLATMFVLNQQVPSAPPLVDQRIAKAEDAVRAAPNNVPARLELGALYQQVGRLDDALAQYAEVLKVDPNNTDARMGHGYVLLTKGDLLGASADYTAVVNANWNGEFAGADTRLEAAYYYLGLIAVKQAQPDVALANLQRALLINPTDSDALYQVGLALELQGKHADAIAAWEKALTFVPVGWCEPYVQMVDSYTALGEPEEATYARAMNLYCHGAHDDAKSRLTDLTHGAAAIHAMLGLGLIAQMEHDNATATEWYRKVLAKDPKNAAALTNLATLGVSPSPTAATKG